MRWFKKDKPSAEKTPADQAEPQPVIETPALTKIRNMCRVADESASTIGVNALLRDHELLRVEKNRFESAKRMSLELAKTIANEFERDTALYLIIELCMRADDVKTAAVLVKAIQTPAIREKLLEDHPVAFY